MMTQGQMAPEVTLPCQDGSSISLSAVRPAASVLFFYSEDGTKTCTQEVLAFAAAEPAFAAAGVRLFGLSRDPVATHAKFAAKHGLTLPLLADEAGQVCEAFGVWQEKQMYGRTYMGVVRSTFLIDGTGMIARAWTNVRLKGHVEEVLAAAQVL
jgi:thioredoxin-dependent peroxiredoxin